MTNKIATVKERVLQLVDNQGFAKESFFKKIGMTYGNFTGSNKKTPLNSTALANLLAEIPDANAEWLLTGNGLMLKELPNVLRENTADYIKSPIAKRLTKPKPQGLIQFYDVDFSAGDIEFYEDNFTIKPAYTMDIPEFNGCTAFRTYNNSMEKLIYSGDIVFATKEESWQDGLEYGQIYGIVCHNGRKYLKYIRKSPDNHATHFLLKSENTQEYDDFELQKDKVKSIWLIHGWLKKRIG
jgi:phage repressor protein C with HTH and peptisase S24 domain